ncbi:MAG: PVC-type heme-binding CxxCH protein [Planctomycetaceae bacterium]
MMVRWLANSIAVMAIISPQFVSAQKYELVAPTDAISAEEQLKQFHLPPGFKIELIAAEPVCRKPMNIKFDAAGRLYFTQSVEYPWPVESGKTGRDTIQVMVDTNDDGVPDKAQTFADGLNIPIGITPLYDGVLAYSIPNIYFFADRDGKLKAQGKEPFYQKWDTVDTHGMCSSLNWWIDGWVYGCHGFRNDSTIAGKDGEAQKFNSGNTYRLKTDGSHIEYYTHGQVNPFGMCFDPYGNVYTSDCHTRPAYQLVRGAFYPSFGKPHDGLGYGPELMQHAHGSTGLAGVVYYAATHFPKEYQENLFIGNPVTGRINRDTLQVTGATYRAIEQPDFLWCDDPWFRPVDIQLAPDGSLYIADFYNKIIGHYEVDLRHPGRDREKGRIWRISYVGMDEKQPVKAPRVPDLTKANVDQLVEFLASDNLTVRVQATHQLVERIGERCVPMLRTIVSDQTTAPSQRAHAIWVLTRLGHPEMTLPALRDQSVLVRVHLLRAAANVAHQSPDSKFVREVIEKSTLFQDPSSLVQRAAAELLGNTRNVEYVAYLAEQWAKANPQDEVLIFTIKVAMRDLMLANSEQIMSAPGLSKLSPAEYARVAEVCLAVPQPQAAAVICRSFDLEPWSDAKAAEFAFHAARYLNETELPTLVKLYAPLQQKPAGVQKEVLRSLQRGYGERGKPLPDEALAWANDLGKTLLAADDEGSRRAGLELVRDLRLNSFLNELPAWLAVDAKYPGLKPLVLDTLGIVGHPQFVEICAQVLARPDEAVGVQHHAAQHLGGRNDDAGRNVLLAALKTASQNLAIGLARGLALGKDGAEALLAAIEKGQASPRLLKDPTVEQRLRGAKLDNFDQRFNALLENLPPEDDRLKQLQASRLERFRTTPGQTEAGAKVFEKNCAACHRLNGKGSKVGPDLDGIGIRGVERLLEDTLDPNRNVDGAFRATVINTVDGKVITGLFLRDEGDIVVIADDQGKELRIKTSEIEERKQLPLSPMPANIAEKVSEADYNDLLAYLLSQKTAPPKVSEK